MTHLAISLLSDSDLFHGDTALWMFLSIGAVALFGVFLPITQWTENRRKEREAFYKAEMIRRVSEASGEGAKAALELLREDDRLREFKKIEGMKVGGLVNIGVGIGLGFLLWSLGGTGSPYLVGLIPALIGVALLVYVFFLHSSVEK